MVSLVNRYFHKNQDNEQKLLNGLVTESIQIQGKTYYYMPRDSQTRDLILGEDAFSVFSMAIPLEMYMVDAQGFQGQKEMFTKFGLQINNSYRLVVSVNRWEQEVKSLFDSGEAKFSITNYFRPHEGDLVYDPLTKFLMVIKFVDHDMEFYSLGKNYAYYLSCEAFMYQNEPINTNIPEIDAFDGLSKDPLNNQLWMENDLGGLLQETGEYILNEVAPTPSRDIEVNFVTPAQTITTVVNDPFNM